MLKKKSALLKMYGLFKLQRQNIN